MHSHGGVVVVGYHRIMCDVAEVEDARTGEGQVWCIVLRAWFCSRAGVVVVLAHVVSHAWVSCA